MCLYADITRHFFFPALTPTPDFDAFSYATIALYKAARIGFYIDRNANDYGHL